MSERIMLSVVVDDECVVEGCAVNRLILKSWPSE